MLALMVGAAQQAQAQKGGAFKSATTGTIKTAESPIVRGYGVRGGWGVKIPRPTPCDKRANPHCHTH